MKLNCKVGDLAVIVRSGKGNEGKIVQCLEFIGDYWWRDKGVSFWSPTWKVDIDFAVNDGYTDHLIADNQLRPIRNDPGQDETLLWADVPSEVTA